MSHEDQSTAQVPPRGSIIVYADDAAGDERRRLHIAEVVGPTMIDSMSGHTWFGVSIPACPDTMDLVDLTRVVNVVPPV